MREAEQRERWEWEAHLHSRNTGCVIVASVVADLLSCSPLVLPLVSSPFMLPSRRLQLRQRTPLVQGILMRGTRNPMEETRDDFPSDFSDKISI